MPSALSTTQLFASVDSAKTPDANPVQARNGATPAQLFSQLLAGPSDATSPLLATGPVDLRAPDSLPGSLDLASTDESPETTDESELAVNPLTIELANLAVLASAPPTTESGTNTKPAKSETTGRLERIESDSVVKLATDTNVFDQPVRYAPNENAIEGSRNPQPTTESPSGRQDAQPHNAGRLNKTNPIETVLSTPNESLANRNASMRPEELPSDAIDQTGPTSIEPNNQEPKLPTATQDSPRPSNPNLPNASYQLAETDSNESSNTTQNPKVEVASSNNIRPIQRSQNESVQDREEAPIPDESLIQPAASRRTLEQAAATVRNGDAVPTPVASQVDNKPRSKNENDRSLDRSVRSTEPSGEFVEEPASKVFSESGSRQTDSPAQNSESGFHGSNNHPAVETSLGQSPIQPDTGRSVHLDVNTTGQSSTDIPAAIANSAPDPNMAAYAVSPNGNDITLPASTTTAQSTVEATGLVGGMENASATSLTDQTVAAVATVIESSDGKSRTMSFNLEPADLGKLTIQITQSGEAIAAQIIASELASSDLLSAQKETLQETLSELGFDDASVDVSHDSQTSRDDKETSSQQNAARSFTFSANQMAPLTPTISSGNGLDIVA